jgi:hypothetical protein
VDEKSNEIPAVRDLLKACADLAGTGITIDALYTQSDTAQVILGRGAGYVMTVKGNMPTLYRNLKKLALACHSLRIGREHGPRPPHHQGPARVGLARVRRRRPTRPVQETDGQAPQLRRHAGSVSCSYERFAFQVSHVPYSVKTVFYLPVAADPGGQDSRVAIALAGDEVDDLDGLLALLRDRALQTERPRQHRRRQPPSPPRRAARTKPASGCMKATLPCPCIMVSLGLDYEEGPSLEAGVVR